MRLTALATLAAISTAAASTARAEQTVASATRPAQAAEPPTGVPGVPTPAGNAEGPYCTAEYADDLGALARAAREFEQKQSPYTYCIRSSATYECPSYAADGSLRKTRRRVVSHGTGFGYRVENGETLIATNEHVSEWPAVTDEEHQVEEVPLGCRRVASATRIVDDESDAYERDDVPLSRVVADHQLDVAILKAKVPLAVMPWKIGRSAAMRERNVVDVRGFPLGVLRANNVGKVISTGRVDEDNGWQHEDFLIDALLSPGNSGSPVFAVSCQSGEFELVGIYHARYTKGSALHTVVGIDQVRELLTTLKRTPPAVAAAQQVEGAQLRERVVASVRASAVEPFFPFGNVPAAIRAREGGALLFEVMSRDFPLQSHAALVLEDLPGDGAGRLGRVWAGNRQGLRAIDPATLEPDAQAQLQKLLDALRRDAALTFAYRAAAPAGASSREQFQEARRLERALRNAQASRGDLVQAALDLSEQLCPRFADATLTMSDVAPPPPPAPAPAFPGLPSFLPAAGLAEADARPIPLAPAPRPRG